MGLKVRNVSKSFGGTVALSQISFTARPGVVALLGPNGSGKSTLLRLLATVFTSDSGEISFAGRPYQGDLRPIRSVIGYLPQDLEPPGHLTPRQLLHYVARIKGVAAEPQTTALLEQLGMAALSYRPLARLSGGQRKRIGIAQALLGSPRLLLLDEPAAGLDAGERARVFSLLRRPVGGGRARVQAMTEEHRAQDPGAVGRPAGQGPAGGRVVVMSSHVPAEVEALATTMVVLRGGSVRYAGPLEGMLRLTRGMVYEVAVPAAAAHGLMQRYPVSRIVSQGETTILRVVGTPPPGWHAEPVQGTLEDGYLLLQRDLP